MSRRQGRVFSQSSPRLANQPGEGHNSEEAGNQSPGSYSARNQSHGAVASHFLAQSPEAFGGQTWMDFLRETGAHRQAHRNQHGELNTQASSPSRYSLSNWPHRFSEAAATSPRSADRRRRLTMPDPHPRRHSSLRTRSVGEINNAEASISGAASLSSPLPRASIGPSHYFRSHGLSNPRRDSDIVLPPWQPDDDVAECPVCNKQFTFLYRRHHCRKCGRVVCSACSPHRITIPRQFVVHPPSDLIAIQFFSEPTHNDNSNSALPNPALGGGEVVRVCNPCVPDPNYSPPPQEHNQHPAFLSNTLQQSYAFNSQQSGYTSDHNLQSNQFSQTPTSSANSRQYHMAAPNTNQPGQGQASARTYNENDYCPVCDILLPPLGPAGDDTARTRHLDDHFNASASASTQASTSHQSLNARGFFPYTATEKDCVTQDGGTAECDICLEDFETGHQLARLACWCKFHKDCIQAWWDKKGSRVCPSHPEQS